MCTAGRRCSDCEGLGHEAGCSFCEGLDTAAARLQGRAAESSSDCEGTASCHPSPPLSSPESSPSSSPSLVVAARRRVVARSRQMYPQLYPHQYPHKCPHRVLVGPCHPSPPLSSPHPPAPVCGDCGGCRAPARLQRGRSDCEGAWTTATVRACGGCSAGFKKAPGCNNSEGAYALQWAWGLQRLRLGVSDCGSEAGAWGCTWSCAAATAAATLGLQ